MKFSQGAWRMAEGVTVNAAKRYYSHAVDGDRLTVHGIDRDDKIEGTILAVNVTSPMPDVIRVHVNHFSPAIVGCHNFELDYALRAEGVTIEEADKEIRFTSGRLTLRVGKGKPWSFRFEDDAGREVTAAPDLGYVTVAGTPRPPLSNGRLNEGTRPGKYLMQRLTLGVGELIYGLGERFGPLVKNGQTVAIWNEDGGTSSDLAYKNIPFYLSSAGYGLLVNHPGQVEFEIGTERVSQIQFSVPGEELDYYVFLGDPKDVLDQYTRLSGRPALPPAWSFGLWLSTSFTTTYNEDTVNEFVEGMASRGIPLSVFHFDCFWMRERHWTDFEWDKRAFPDPEGMLKRLKARGLKICVWINSYIAQMSCLFPEGREKGYFLKRADGSVYQRDAWQPGMALVDFTNPEAVAWYQGHLKRLMDMGVDCFKTDFAELIPLDVVYHDGSDPERMHNLYSYYYNKVVFEVVERERGVGQGMVFARSGTVGAQKFPVHWGGDCWSTWEAMAEDLRGGLSFCSSGPAFWSHDIGGFEGTANPANYKRWVAFGLLSTHSRLHGSNSYRVPWLFDEESVDVMRHFTELKNTLFPYLFAVAHVAQARGTPALRTMFVEFPKDPGCRYLDGQYMLGDALLVAPVFNEAGVCEHYVPSGTWTDLLTGERVQGGTWRRTTHDFFHLPLLLREDTILPTSTNDQQPAWAGGDELVLTLGHLTANAAATTRVVPGDGGRAVTFVLSRDGDKVVLTADGAPAGARFGIRLVGGQTPGDVANGKAGDAVGGGAAIAWTNAAAPLTFALRD